MNKTAVVLLSLIVLMACNKTADTGVNNPYLSDDNAALKLSEEELRNQLQEIECENAVKYLEGSGRAKPIYKGLLSTKVRGLKVFIDIENTAAIAAFKDIVVQLDLLSKTGSRITSKDIKIYEFLSPHGKIEHVSEVSISNQQYKDYADFEWFVREASCVK